MGVPTVLLNGTMFGNGRLSLEEILAKVDASGVEREAKKIAEKAQFDVLIVGGGPAGAALLGIPLALLWLYASWRMGREHGKLADVNEAKKI